MQLIFNDRIRLESITKTIFSILIYFLLSGCIEKSVYLYDIDGNSYQVKEYGEVWWMTENLKATKDHNGNDVSYYFPNNSEATKDKYGLLYDYATACSVCPDGWRLPNNMDWENLINLFGGEMASKLFKDVKFWQESVTNESGMSILPAGYGNSGEHPNAFNFKSYLWSNSGSEEFKYAIIFESEKDKIRMAEQHPTYAYSIRCIRNMRCATK